MFIVLPFECAEVLRREPQLFSDGLRMLGDVPREIRRIRLGSPQKKSELPKRIRQHARQRGQRCRVGKLRGDRRGVLLQQGLERREITAEPESDLPNLPRDGERVDASSDADEVLPE